MKVTSNFIQLSSLTIVQGLHFFEKSVLELNFNKMVRSDGAVFATFQQLEIGTMYSVHGLSGANIVIFE